jgi:hypothetical protein
MYSSATAQVDGLQPPFRVMASADLADRLRRRSGFTQRRRRLALRVVDLACFSPSDFAIAASRAPCAMLICSCRLPSGRRDHRALLALRGDLRLHRAQDLAGGVRSLIS